MTGPMGLTDLKIKMPVHCSGINKRHLSGLSKQSFTISSIQYFTKNSTVEALPKMKPKPVTESTYNLFPEKSNLIQCYYNPHRILNENPC